jgi:hypothetical protein
MFIPTPPIPAVNPTPEPDCSKLGVASESAYPVTSPFVGDAETRKPPPRGSRARGETPPREGGDADLLAPTPTVVFGGVAAGTGFAPLAGKFDLPPNNLAGAAAAMFAAASSARALASPPAGPLLMAEASPDAIPWVLRFRSRGIRV